ncbi:MAG: 4-hydroxybenzoate polyprenyltransferase [Chthoniobacter sp.]|nr:4-hydroxybenzoate polyprenyltransferase [Chthoniobacter sp.]
MFVAARGWPPASLFLLILGAMVFARTAAMSFNRLADWEIDQRNPRTAGRHKLVSRKMAIALLLASSAGFIASAFWINRICFALSPVALAIVFFYSLTKRFTALSHFFLGLALAVSPVGAWLAVRGHLELPPLVLGFAVVCWVAGFDLIYATQDEQFDKAAGLHSMVVRLGAGGALALAQTLHGIMWLALAAFGWVADLGTGYFVGVALMMPALAYEHWVARLANVDAINRAFFHSNAFVSFVFLVATCFDQTNMR